jgi:hypothetical protein
MKPTDLITLVVLDDGATYSAVEGCALIVVTRADLERVEQMSGDASDFRPVVEIGLGEVPA